MIDAGRRSKWRSIRAWIALVGDPPGPERIDREADRLGDPDAVRDLDLEPVGQAGGDHVLGHPARGIGRRAVDLGRILAREGAAAVARHPAVAVDDDLAAGQAGVAHRAAGHEPPGRVDVHDRVGRAQLGRDRRQDDRLDDVGAEPLGADVGVVLGGDDDGPDPLRDAVLVLDRDLRLAVRAGGTAAGRTCGPRPAGAPSGGPARSAAASARGSRGRRTRTSSPGRRRRARTPRPRRRGSRAPRPRPCAMSGDCSLTEISVPQVR